MDAGSNPACVLEALVEQEDPKALAKRLRYTPETEGVLKQFQTLESGNYARKGYRDAWDRMHKAPMVLKRKMTCVHDGYVAETIQDLEWHEDQTHHDADHDFVPYVEPEPVHSVKVNCSKCGGPHVDRGDHKKKDHTKHRCEYCKKFFTTELACVGAPI